MMQKRKSLIDEVTQLTMQTAPYPNEPLAFCGAMALMSLLCSRKVVFEGMTPNIYILGLANSGSGKNWPRQVISKLLAENGMATSLGDSFSSGEAIEDAVYQKPAMLFLNDEFDTIVRSMAGDKETRFESTKLMLLKLFTSAGGLYFCRRKASDEGQRTVFMPSLILFGTCTPQAFYESVNASMMQSGLVARMLVVDAGKRGPGQRPKPIVASSSIIEAIQYWRDFAPGNGNLSSLTPEPMELVATPGASKALDTLRNKADECYVTAEGKGDGAAMACWARAYEHAVKLSMLQACSVNYLKPVITEACVKFAGDFALRQVAEMLRAIDEAASDSPFDKLSRRVLKFVRDADDGLTRSELLRLTRIDSKQFDLITRTLQERGDLTAVEGASSGGRRPIIFTYPLGTKRGTSFT